jgi:Fe-S cluster biogenesis protein NfuA
MYIQIEATPNDNALKFLVEDLYHETEITSSNIPDDAPEFVKKIFEMSEIEKIFITADFITIIKREKDLWEPLKPIIFQILLEAKMNPANKPARSEEVIDYSNLDEISKQIIELLDERIKPAVNMDGGDISFVKFDLESGIVYVKLKGSCSGCPSSKITLQSGIKRTLQHYIPEVSDVAEA